MSCFTKGIFSSEAEGTTKLEQLLPEPEEKATEEGTARIWARMFVQRVPRRLQGKSAGRNTLHLTQEFQNHPEELAKKRRTEK